MRRDAARFLCRGESQTYFLHVVVASPGYVPIELRWGGSNIPDAYNLRTSDRGATIGGTLRDEKGRPVPDAQVMACVTNRPPKGPSQLYPTMGEEVAATISDPQGHWRSSSIPEGLDAGASIEVRVTHPESRRVANQAVLGRGPRPEQRAGPEARVVPFGHSARYRRPSGGRRDGSARATIWGR